MPVGLGNVACCCCNQCDVIYGTTPGGMLVPESYAIDWTGLRAGPPSFGSGTQRWVEGEAAMEVQVDFNAAFTPDVYDSPSDPLHLRTTLFDGLVHTDYDSLGLIHGKCGFEWYSNLDVEDVFFYERHSAVDLAWGNTPGAFDHVETRAIIYKWAVDKIETKLQMGFVRVIGSLCDFGVAALLAQRFHLKLQAASDWCTGGSSTPSTPYALSIDGADPTDPAWYGLDHALPVPSCSGNQVVGGYGNFVTWPLNAFGTTTVGVTGCVKLIDDVATFSICDDVITLESAGTAVAALGWDGLIDPQTPAISGAVATLTPGTCV